MAFRRPIGLYTFPLTGYATESIEQIYIFAVLCERRLTPLTTFIN